MRPLDERSNSQRIVALYLSRSESAIKETMQCYGSRLLHLVMRFLGDRRDAEECVNDAYLKAWNSIPPQKPEDLFSYLARLCRCTAYNLIEKQQAAKRSTQLVELTQEMEECIPDGARENEYEDSRLTELINEFLRTLPQEQRNMFVRRYWYGESIEAIAGGMGFTESKVKTSLCRMRAKMRSYFDKKGVSLCKGTICLEQ